MGYPPVQSMPWWHLQTGPYFSHTTPVRVNGLLTLNSPNDAPPVRYALFPLRGYPVKPYIAIVATSFCTLCPFVRLPCGTRRCGPRPQGVCSRPTILDSQGHSYNLSPTLVVLKPLSGSSKLTP